MGIERSAPAVGWRPRWAGSGSCRVRPPYCVRPSPLQSSLCQTPTPPPPRQTPGSAWLIKGEAESVAARSRHDAVCLSGSKGPNVGRWGSPPAHCPLCRPPSPAGSLCVGLLCSAWTEDKDQGGRWPFETTHSQYTPCGPPQLRPVSPAQYNIAAVEGGGVGVPCISPAGGRLLLLLLH